MAFNSEQQANAKVIRDVGLSMGMSERDILIALMTAQQESGLRNLSYGDRDSVGLFQQRTSQGWGSVKQIMDPRYSASKFYETLAKVKGRDSLALTVAAQKVQRSAFPNAYAKHEGSSRQLLASLGGDAPAAPSVTPAPSVTAGRPIAAPGVDPAAPETAPGVLSPTPVGVGAADSSAVGVVAAGEDDPALALAQASRAEAEVQEVFLPEVDRAGWEQQFSASLGGASGKAADVIAEARKYLGTPYKWGGTGPLGFDCSGLLKFVYGKFGVSLPRVSYQQAAAGKRVGATAAQAGDLWSIDNSDRNNGADHIALYVGNNQILEAARAGTNVRVRTLSAKELSGGVFNRVL